MVEEREMSLDDMLKIIKESIKQNKGLISYRKHFELLLKLDKRIELLAEYRKNLVKDVDDEINSLTESVGLLREKIKEAMASDESIEKTDTGGKTVNLPDLGVLSLSKEQKRVVIVDAQAVLTSLGEEAQKITISLDKTKAKPIIEEKLEKGEAIEGAEMEAYRELRVTKKK